MELPLVNLQAVMVDYLERQGTKVNHRQSDQQAATEQAEHHNQVVVAVVVAVTGLAETVLQQERQTARQAE